MVESAIAGRVSVAPGVFAPGHVGELTQVLDFELVDAVAAETGTVQRRVRLLPTRVVVYFVLALVLFEDCGYRLVWEKLTASLGALVRPSASALCRARRRVGAKPLQALFEAVAGPVAAPGVAGVWWRGLRLVAWDATYLRAPDVAAVRRVLRRRGGAKLVWGYPLVRLSVLIECGTKAVIGAAFGSDTVGENGYARRLLPCLRPDMLLLADAYYDDRSLLAQVNATGAAWLVRSTATRTPLVAAKLGDGSYLSRLSGRRRGQQLDVRVIEAWLTIRYTDDSLRRVQWRLLTSLTDHRRYPAGELVTLYHDRWEAETCFRSIKCTILDGRVLRSGFPADIDQEIWALLTVYQTLVRLSVEAVTDTAATTATRTDPDRVSLTVAWQTARDQVVLAQGIQPSASHPCQTAIGTAVRAHLLPPRRQRGKARTKKIATSQYKTAGTSWPKTSLSYTIDTHITIFEEGLTARSNP
jgi:hypothetical protein